MTLGQRRCRRRLDSAGVIRSPNAGRTLFGDHAERWMPAWITAATTTARDRSVMRTHVLPQWGSWQLAKIDHLAVRTWISGLGTALTAHGGAVLHAHLGRAAVGGPESAYPGEPGRGCPVAAYPPPGLRRSDHRLPVAPDGAAPGAASYRCPLGW